MRLISGFIDTYLRLNPQETLQFEREADTMLDRNEKAKVMELTTSWKEEGRQEGRQEGWQEGQADLVLRQLHRRLRRLSPECQDRVRALSVDQLQNLGEALLDFRTEDDLQRWLSS